MQFLRRQGSKINFIFYFIFLFDFCFRFTYDEEDFWKTSAIFFTGKRGVCEKEYIVV